MIGAAWFMGFSGVEGLDSRLLVAGCWLLVKNRQRQGQRRRFWLRQNDDAGVGHRPSVSSIFLYWSWAMA
jgi:hypothetical protein